jgi:mannosyltransferase OCH1-like enzyme
MNTRKYLLLLLILIILLFFWQVFLILFAVKDNFPGINFNSFNINSNATNSTIPRIIHQMWKTENLLTYPIQSSHSTWKELYPNYKIRLWTDEDLKELLNKEEYKYLKLIYNSYPYSIQRADLGRLIILHSEGGIYADLDVFPCSNEIENLRLSNVSFLIPRSSTGSSLINHFLMAQKSSIILDFILHEITERKFYQRIYLIPYLEVFSTGSFFLNRAIKKYLQLSHNSNHFLWILSEHEVTYYVTHHNGRSWHLLDGFILNQINAKPKIFISILILLIISVLFIFIYRNSMLKFIQFTYKKIFFIFI